MINRSLLALAIVSILLTLTCAQSQTPPSSSSLDTAEAIEATRLAVEVTNLFKLGKHKEALPLAKRCLTIREKIFTPADEPLRIALHNLAELYVALQKFRDSEALLERLIKSYEEFATKDARLVGVIQRLAQVNFVMGEHRNPRLSIAALWK